MYRSRGMSSAGSGLLSLARSWRRGSSSVSGTSVTLTVGDDEAVSEIVDQVLSSPDLLHAILAHLKAVQYVRPLLRTSKKLRAAALRPDHWWWQTADMSRFNDLIPLAATTTIGAVVRQGMQRLGLQSSIQNSWSVEAVLRICATKTRLRSLDLAGCKFFDNLDASVSALVRALPTSLEVLAFSRPPKAVGQLSLRRSAELAASGETELRLDHAILTALRHPALAALPHLHTLDLRGVMSERTFASHRILTSVDQGGDGDDETDAGEEKNNDGKLDASDSAGEGELVCGVVEDEEEMAITEAKLQRAVGAQIGPLLELVPSEKPGNGESLVYLDRSIVYPLVVIYTGAHIS